MNKRNIIIIVLLFCVIAIAIGVVLFLIFQNDNQLDSEISIPTSSGENINVNDFKSTSEQVDGSAYTLKDIPDTAVFLYNEESNIFNILIHANEESDFERKKIIAENYFINQLGISKDQACTLNVEVSTDGPENDIQSFSKVQKLSFCK